MRCLRCANFYVLCIHSGSALCSSLQSFLCSAVCKRSHTKKWAVFLLLTYCSTNYCLSADHQPGPIRQIKESSQDHGTGLPEQGNRLVRDPFSPMASGDCSTEAMLFHQWILGGVVGHPNDRHGWIIRPNGSWKRLTQGERLSGKWQVVHIDAQRIDLLQMDPARDCPVLTQSVFRARP